MQQILLRRADRKHQRLRDEVPRQNEAPRHETPKTATRMDSGRFSIRFKLFVELFLVAMIPLVVVGSVLYIVERAQVMRDVEDDLAAVAEIQESRITDTLQDRTEDFPGFLADTRMISALELVSEGGCGAGTPNYRVIELLQEIVDEHPASLAGLTLSDADGCIRASTYPDQAGLMLSPDTVPDANTGDITHSDLHMRNGDLVQDLSVAIVESGVRVANVVVTANVDWLNLWAADYTGLGDTGEMVLATPSEHGPVFITPLRFDADAAFKEVRLPTASDDRGPIPMVVALSGEETWIEDAPDYRGVSVMAVTRYVESTGWGVVVKIDRAEAFASLNTLLRLGSVGVAVLLIVIALLAVRISRRRTAPILNIVDAATAVAGGDLSARATVTTKDEVASLAMSVNAMANELVGRHRTLENEVKDRTEDLTGAIASLEQSNVDLERFAATAAHDLQEPLRKIRIFGGRLADRAGDGLDERSRDYLNRMTGAAERMQALIDGMLTYSRVTTRAEPFVWVDLNEVVADVVSDLEISFDEAGATVVVDDLPHVMGDPSQLRQLFQNLISNSVKYRSPDRELWVRVFADVMRQQDLEEASGECLLVIDDNGIGVPEERREQIFGMFARLHSSQEIPGAGVGLALCRRIVAEHRGTIACVPKPSPGLRIVATLPIESRRGGQGARS